MRGVRVSKASQKDYDLVVIAARYLEEDHSLDIVQVLIRRGPIWGDVELLTRSEIIDAIESDHRVVVGRLADVQGDFEVSGELRLMGENGLGRLVVGERKPAHDDLQVPLF